MDWLDPYTTLIAQLHTMCKPSRIIHSKSVARTMRDLCLRYDADADAGVLSGLLHDSCKDMKIEHQWEYALKAADIEEFKTINAIVKSMENQPSFSGKVIHGPAAAMFAFEQGITDDIVILESLALHSTGSTDMTILSKLLFIADKLEPLRPYRNISDDKAMESMDVDELLLYALKQSMTWVRREQGTIAESTIDLYNILTEQDRMR
jgi:nicotinate-nucleotide adenylyltransferase